MPAIGQETGLTGRPEAPSPYPFPHLVRSSADFADLSSLQRLSQGEEERLLRAPREAQRHSQISVLGRRHGLFVSPRLKSQATCPAKALGFCLVWVCFLALPPTSILPLLTPIRGPLDSALFPRLGLWKSSEDEHLMQEQARIHNESSRRRDSARGQSGGRDEF